MRFLQSILVATIPWLLGVAPALASAPAPQRVEATTNRDLVPIPNDMSWPGGDDSEAIADKDMKTLPQAFVRAARLAELASACRWGASAEERATARDRLLWAAAAIARRVGVSSTHAQRLVEVFTSDEEILSPIQADVAKSVKDARVCEDDAMRATWEVSAFPGSQRI